MHNIQKCWTRVQVSLSLDLYLHHYTRCSLASPSPLPLPWILLSFLHCGTISTEGIWAILPCFWFLQAQAGATWVLHWGRFAVAGDFSKCKQETQVNFLDSMLELRNENQFKSLFRKLWPLVWSQSWFMRVLLEVASVQGQWCTVLHHSHYHFTGTVIAKPWHCPLSPGVEQEGKEEALNAYPKNRHLDMNLPYSIGKRLYLCLLFPIPIFFHIHFWSKASSFLVSLLTHKI